VQPLNQQLPPSHIFVGISGGIDSSVAAYLLKKAGHRVEGVFMKNWEGDDTDTYCSAANDLADAEAVCDSLNIPLHRVNFADEYWERVFALFLDEYRAGRTPNPDILCNKEIKFRAFLDYAKQQGADYIATGHYAGTETCFATDDPKKMERLSGHIRYHGVHLRKGIDPLKDQSYFLYALTAAQLAQSLFPVGDLQKSEVRAIAKEIGLTNHAKKDSTGICFIGERKFKTFLNEYLPAKPGSMETPEGEQMGTHDGLMFYTIGQREGLQIGGKKGKSESPWYVASKDIKRNALIIVQGENHPALFKKTLVTEPLHWINEAPVLPLHVMAKTRYRQPDQACTITTEDGMSYRIHFEEAQRAITPGQSIVFYQDDICLGGGIITS
jgi:tRNA-specific 2-thiouridylase